MKTLNTFRRYIPLLSLLISVIVLCVSWLVSYPYFLRWLEGYSFFSTLPDFVAIHYDLPGDMMKYIGAFLLQFYSVPFSGALIQALIAVLFVSCLWVCVKRLFAGSESFLWLAFIPLPVFVHYQLSDLTLSRALTWLTVAFAVMLLVIMLTVRKKHFLSIPSFLKNAVISSVMSLILLASAATLLVKGNDNTRGYESVAYLEYLGKNKQWDKILQTVSRQESINNEYKRKYVLLALVNTGRLPEYAFSYGLSDSDDFLFDNIQEPFCLGFNVLFYNSLGMYNPAIYNAYQKSVQSTPGMSFDVLRFLADTYLSLGDHAMAKKYLDILSHSTCHGKWVEARLPRLEQLKGNTPEYSIGGPLFPMESFLPDISSMYDRYPADRRFADLLLCGVLAEKDGMAFYNIFQVVSKYIYPEGKGIPGLYQEALLLAASQNPEILNGYKIDEEVWKRFADFTSLMQKGQTAQAKRKYSETYWAYIY